MSANKRGRPAVSGKMLYLRVPAELHARILEAASADNRCMSDWVRIQIQELFERRESHVGHGKKARRAVGG